MADGQSQHSFSNNSGRYLAGNVFPSNLVTSRQGKYNFRVNESPIEPTTPN